MKRWARRNLPTVVLLAALILLAALVLAIAMPRETENTPVVSAAISPTFDEAAYQSRLEVEAYAEVEHETADIPGTYDLPEPPQEADSKPCGKGGFECQDKEDWERLAIVIYQEAGGDDVCAVGNPLGELEFTMTSGMISALDRTITTSDGTDNGIHMFQIDAAVNAGNSGGPVYNTSGQVIGIVTAKYSSSGVEGLGFAIPVNDAVAIANDLMKNGTVTDRAQLGITLQTIPDSAAQYYNMPKGA